MSGQGSNQSMDRVKSQLECPVCFNIPRDLPIPSCSSGHIVCRPCKKRVTECPTCRQPMPANMTNSLAGALVEQVQHSCKFSGQGCEVKMMLKDLVAHEKECPDRTIKCPWPGCAHLVKLTCFDSHALEDEDFHSLDLEGGSAFHYKIIEKNVVCSSWPMGCIKALDELFHVNLAYDSPSQCFVSVFDSLKVSVMHLSTRRAF